MDGSTGLRRLNRDGYVRPKKTYTDTLQSNGAIENKLENFRQFRNEIDKL